VIFYLITLYPDSYLFDSHIVSMEPVIEKIFKEIEIKCRCGFEGAITAKQVYYTNCPECQDRIYVRHLTQDD